MKQIKERITTGGRGSMENKKRRYEVTQNNMVERKERKPDEEYLEMVMQHEKLKNIR